MADVESLNGVAASDAAAEAATPEETGEAYSPPVTTSEDDHDATAVAVSYQDDDGEDVDNQDMQNGDLERNGTTSSGRFNILSTMVGGGSLSLPMAFQKSGNALLAPILLIGTAMITEFCFRLLVRSARTLHPVSASTRTPGCDSFESIAAAAFGPKALVFSKALVVLMCFFGTVAYAVLLRDMFDPITKAIYNGDASRWHGNTVILPVVLLVTPLCTLKTLTALKRFGAASMFSVFILGCCVLFRSIQCNLRHISSNDWAVSFRLFPEKWMDVLDVIPLYISCYVCHYNILTVHNELRRPSEKRVSWWLRSTTWTASVFYLVLGFSGSAYATCAKDGPKISGNILLDFDDSDPLVLVGRMCLAITITLAFPMLTIPARDIVIRSMKEYQQARAAAASPRLELSENQQQEADLAEPLLADNNNNNEHQNSEAGQEGVVPVAAAEEEEANVILNTSLGIRLGIAIILFWAAAALACCVESIDIVWDLLGSSLSIILSYLIPCGSYIVIMRRSSSQGHTIPIAICWLFLAFFVPLMFISTANAVCKTFF